MSESKKILFVAIPNIKGQLYSGAIRVERLAKYLQQLGWECYCLTLARSRFRQRTDAVQEKRTYFKKIYIAHSWVLEGIRILKYKLFDVQKKSVLSHPQISHEKRKRNVHAFFRKFLRSLCIPDKEIVGIGAILPKGLCALTRENIDIIIAVGPPFSCSVFGFFLGILTKKPLVIDYKDSWIDNPFYEETFSFARSIKEKIEKKIVARAKLITCTTPIILREIRERNKTRADKMYLLPNGFDRDSFKTESIADEKNDALVIGHFGSISSRRLPSAFLHALREVNNRDNIAHKLKIYFVGNFENKLIFEALIRKLCLDNIVSLLPEISYQEYLRWLNRTDVLLVIPGASYAVPGKLYEYAASGKPILSLGEKNSAANWFLQETKTGFCLEDNDIHALAAFITTLLQTKKEEVPNVLFFNPDREQIKKYDRLVIAQTLSDLLIKKILHA